MVDSTLKAMEGRWFLQYTGCPMWKKGNVDAISYNYTLQHRGEELVLKDVIEFRRNGKMRTKSGIEIPEGDGATFQWKGIGMGNGSFRDKSKVLVMEDDLLVVWYSKTRSTPESIDILTRKRYLNSKESEFIFARILKEQELVPYLEELEAVNTA